MTPEQIARLRAEHQARLQQWWRAMPGTEARYRQACALLGGRPGSLLWNGHMTTDAAWDAHEVRHAFGVRDPLVWLGLQAELTANGHAELCGYGGPHPAEHGPNPTLVSPAANSHVV